MSVLLLGPRHVGKSTLIDQLNPDIKINLANEGEYYLFQSELTELECRIDATQASTIFIDEIQRIPRLTNTIQGLIDQKSQLKFYLTGSSVKKLRKGKANLLPGRIISYPLGPLVAKELGSDWDENKILSIGSLPGKFTNPNSKEQKSILRSYVATYLKEEIQAEALVRHVDGFVRFINSVAQEAGSYLDITKLSKKAKVPRQTIDRHFETLEDTLIARKTVNDPDLYWDQVDLIKHSRFYFFDIGVLNALRGSFIVNQERIGFLFEHLVFNQLFQSAHAFQKEIDIYNFRTRGGLEVDFILKLDGKKLAIECKGSNSVSSSELNPLIKLDKYYPKIKKLVFYRGKRELKENGIWIVPLLKGLEILGLL